MYSFFLLISFILLKFCNLTLFNVLCDDTCTAIYVNGEIKIASDINLKVSVNNTL